MTVEIVLALNAARAGRMLLNVALVHLP